MCPSWFKLRKAEVVASAAETKKTSKTASTHHQTSARKRTPVPNQGEESLPSQQCKGDSKGKKRKSSLEDGQAKKKYRYECSSDWCTNQALKEGLCKQHGAQIKRCSSKGCINQAQRGGVFAMHGAKVKQCSSEGCTNKVVNGRAWIRHWSKKKLCSNEGCTNQAKQRGRHGAYRNTQDGSTAFGSEYEMTTATQTSPNQRTSSRVVVREGQERSSVPEEVTICQEIVEVWCALCWVDVW